MNMVLWNGFLDINIYIVWYESSAVVALGATGNAANKSITQCNWIACDFNNTMAQLNYILYYIHADTHIQIEHHQ